MNKTLKTVLIILNLIMLGVSVYWFTKQNEPEPLIVIFGQAATLLSLFFEKQASDIMSSKIENTDVDVDVVSGDNVHSSEIKDSNITIKTKK